MEHILLITPLLIALTIALLALFFAFDGLSSLRQRRRTLRTSAGSVARYVTGGVRLHRLGVLDADCRPGSAVKPVERSLAGELRSKGMERSAGRLRAHRARRSRMA